MIREWRERSMSRWVDNPWGWPCQFGLGDEAASHPVDPQHDMMWAVPGRGWVAAWDERLQLEYGRFETMNDERSHGDSSAVNDTDERPMIRSIDPCALATLTSGIMLVENFSVVGEAAAWVLGYPVFTHEYIDPKIQAAIIAAITEQFPDMPVRSDEKTDYRETIAEVRAKYGETVEVRRGTAERDRDPETTLRQLAPDADITVLEVGDNG